VAPVRCLGSSRNAGLALTAGRVAHGVSGMHCSNMLLENYVGVDILLTIQVLGSFQTFTSSLIVLFFLLNHGACCAAPLRQQSRHACR